MKNVIVVQARENSSRLPNKVLEKILGKTILQIVVDKCLKLENVSNVVVAIPVKNNNIKKLCDELQYNYVTGSEKNVLQRFIKVIDEYGAENIIRINSDCPFFDIEVSQLVINEFLNNYDDLDYASNTIEKSFPQGLDIEIVKSEILKKIYTDTLDEEDLEHVTLFIRKNAGLFKVLNIVSSQDFGNYRLTIDTPEDLIILKWIASHYAYSEDIKYDDKLEKILTSETYREYNRNNTSDSLVNNYLQNTYMQKYEITYLI